jgi:hypothetical protein
MIEAMLSGEMARIFLKDGNEKMGLLLNDVENPDTFDEGVKFIPHNKVGEWYKSFSQDCIQVLEPELVDGIDLFMK